MRKNERTPSLQALRAFRRVVELRSFQAAADALGVSGGSVSKLVAQLEADVGVRLLQRTTRTVGVTEEGHGLYTTAVRMDEELFAGLEDARHRASSVSGLLRVAVPTSFALMWMSRRMPVFMAAHPHITLDLSLSDSFVDLVALGFDCAIRIASNLPDSGLVARTLGQTAQVLVAAPAYLDVAPPLHNPQDLVSHACMVYTQTTQPLEWPATFPGQTAVKINAHYRVNNSVMLRDALLAGQGLALTPHFVVADLLASGQLLEVLPAYRLPDLTVFGVVPHSRYLPRKVRIFLDFMADEMAASV
jgi:DNA-binding transcriptional LysR family regulator